MASPSARATGGGKALPTCRYAAVFRPGKAQLSGNPWIRATLRTVSLGRSPDGKPGPGGWSAMPSPSTPSAAQALAPGQPPAAMRSRSVSPTVGGLPGEAERLREEIAFVAAPELLPDDGERRAGAAAGQQVDAAEAVPVQVVDVAFDDLPFRAAVAPEGLARVRVEFRHGLVSEAGLFQAECLPAGSGADLQRRQPAHDPSSAGCYCQQSARPRRCDAHPTPDRTQTRRRSRSLPAAG